MLIQHYKFAHPAAIFNICFTAGFGLIMLFADLMVIVGIALFSWLEKTAALTTIGRIKLTI